MLTCPQFSVCDTNRKNHPVWTCETCQKTVQAHDGFIGAQWAHIRRLHSPGEDHIVWHCHHGTCEDPDSDVWYFQSIHQVATWDRIAGLTHRLERDHPWVEFSGWDRFLHAQHTLAGAR